MTDLPLAIVLGGAFGIGVCLLLSLAPRWGAPGLARRIGPYIRDVTDPAGVTLPASASASASAGASATGVGAVARRAQALLTRHLGGADGVDRRLRQAGRDQDAAAFRGRQLAWAVGGVAIGGVVVVILALTAGASGSAVLVPPLLGVAGAVLCDVELSRAAARRVARIQDELPTVLEFVALCLSAGEGILDSLRRVGDVGAGELTGELRRVVVAVGTGSPLSESLSRLARRLDIPPLSRAIDQLVAAIEHGSPLAHVLHSQALDAREDAKRALIEGAGRREIGMLIPLVFGVLPLSVLFAVYPGVFMLRLGIG